MYGTLLKSAVLSSGIEEKLVPTVFEKFDVSPKMGWEDTGKSSSDFVENEVAKDEG